MVRVANQASRLGWAATAICLLAHAAPSSAAAAPRSQGADTRQCSWSKYGHPFPVSDEGTCPLPVNEESDSFAPWSHRPHCIEPALAPLGSSEYCVFTDATFRNGRGLSIITTPELAAALAPQLDDTSVVELFESHPPAGPKDPMFQVKEIRGRGKGVIAKKRIPKWEVTMVDFPVLITKADLFEVLDEGETAELKELAVSRLPAETKKAVMGLAHSLGQGLELIEDIIKTNLLPFDLAGVTHMGLFLYNSRVNHHCQPNAYWRYSPKTLTSELIAIDTILSGDEISHSYIPIGLPKNDRQKLLGAWHFNCTCSICTAPKDKTWGSEMRRMRLMEIFNHLQDIPSLSKGEIEATEREMMILIQQENLQQQLTELYGLMAKAYTALFEFDLAREYATKSEELWIRYGTENHDNVDGIKQLWEEIEQKEKLISMGPKDRWYYGADDEDHDEIDD